MPELNPPQDRSLPLFVYGSLKPGELAFGLIEPLVSRHVEATVAGVIRLRDGLPLLGSSPAGRVHGNVLCFPADNLDEVWQVVADFEPGSQYRWDTTEAMTKDGQSVPVNVLSGKKPQSFSGDPVSEWSARHDPVLNEGLTEVRRLALEAAPQGVPPQSDNPAFWHQFFRLQASYLLLWSVVERYTALRYGPALDPGNRVRRLGNDPAFQAALKDLGAKPDRVVDSRNPADSIALRPDGRGGARYYYLVRSNLSHRGKGAFRDARLVLKALVELHDAMLDMLANHVSIPVDSDEDEVRLRHLLPY
ncbi:MULTISPECIES: gamma-glutamylcyclotransferase [unclassified Micromonospora]|uniref:gamma-glutamylcyclotransferase n=1 Tax=unclassified Micromonospora TaxID=2617518 RepID=UPI0036269B20